MTRVSILPSYDNQNGWLEILGPQGDPTVLTGSVDADHVVIGAGFGGLAAARRLAELAPDQSIVLLEADRLGNNAAGRCSGFIIDHAHNIRAKGFADDTANARRGIALNRAGPRLARRDRPPRGHRVRLAARGQDPRRGLGERGGDARRVRGVARRGRRGVPPVRRGRVSSGASGRTSTARGCTPRTACWSTRRSSSLGLAKTMPDNVRVSRRLDGRRLRARPAPHAQQDPRQGSVRTPSLVLAANGFGEGFGFFKNKLIPLITWGSMTRPLTDEEVERLGGEDNYGDHPRASRPARRFAAAPTGGS